ncbi:1-acyl-sn-glycerol-3-phosphate acyltransferases [Pedococcus dokdonensis]|uniref:1-acyl-sn-glycerol-3-phosphate acyltransferases n=1 Tax=Pedococcus dokdonensis TaxID=443156 RepID=A0A1H0QD78_9MICO|nr:lysophospholipid acyltransferase family protein [Pedococcus dokdonensis]SDP15302.1 1-acyl-sn-glycerol-3-phosphate acyltransferases [Pedococcus dokdonensis]
MEPVYTPVIGVARALFAFQGLKITMTGTEHVPRHGGAVLAINHTGYFDFTYAGLVGVEVGRYVRFMAKKSIWSNPVAGPLMRGMRHIPVDRAAGQGSFDAARQALRAGELVGVFPEATISRSFELKGFKSGTVRLAQEAGVPVLPTTIWGSQRIWTKGQPRRMGRHGIPLLITVGPPIVVAPEENAVRATARVRDAMQAQLHADQERYPTWPAAERHLLPVRLGGTAPTVEEAEEMDRADRRRRAGG